MDTHRFRSIELALKPRPCTEAEEVARNMARDLLRLTYQLARELRNATAYVELHTSHGVRAQPESDVIRPNGDYDAEVIAARARKTLSTIGG